MNYLFVNNNKNNFVNNWFYPHIIDSLKKAENHCDILLYSPKINIIEFEKEIIDTIFKNKIEIFFTSLNHKVISCKLITRLNELSIKTVLFCPDNLLYPFRHKKSSKYFNLVWITSLETKYLFDRWKAKTIYLPYAANPDMKKSHTTKKIIRKVVFIGKPYGSRANVINYLTANEVPVVIYNGTLKNENNYKIRFKKFSKPMTSFSSLLINSIGRRVLLSKFLQFFNNNSKLDIKNKYLTIKNSVSFDDMTKIYSQYALCLSFTSARNTDILDNPVNVVNLRNFEIPAFQGVQLVRRTSEIMRLFDCGKEIICYKDNSDLLNKINYFLNIAHDDEISTLQEQGYKRVLKDHTWIKRFESIEDFLK